MSQIRVRNLGLWESANLLNVVLTFSFVKVTKILVRNAKLLAMTLYHLIWDPRTTSLTRSSAFIGCAPHSGLNIKLPCWRTKYYMGALRDTWVRWFQSPIYKAGGHCVLPATIALWCLPSGSLPSVAGLSRLLLHASGTPCQRRRRQLSRWRHAVDTSSHGCSASRIQISSSDLCSRLSNCVM